MNRKICIITGSRAEYGLLCPLMKEIMIDPSLDLQVIVTGMHLSPKFGLTYKEIEKDGFRIDHKIDIELASDNPIGISKSMALAVKGFAEAYEKLAPDIIVVLGDRFETFAAAASAHVARIPIAHIHGGEITEGAVDDAFRHSITKMSYWHFTSTADYRNRVIQLGESPDRVFNVGAIGLDNIKNMNLMSKDELEHELGFRFNERNLLVTFHPVTLENNTAGAQFTCLLDALDELKGTNIIFTKANADTDGQAINKMIDEYVAKRAGKAVAFASMGQRRYLSAMQFVDAVVGNSSSGIIEAPSFKIATINIGDRQKGRLMPGSVINCSPEREKIINALKTAYSREFKEKTRALINPYESDGVAMKIKNILKSASLGGSILKKEFYNIKL